MDGLTPRAVVTPNPNGGSFHLEYTITGPDTKYDIKIYNVLGQLITTIKGFGWKGVYSRDVNLNVVSGVYFVQVNQNGHSFVCKLVVLQ